MRISQADPWSVMKVSFLLSLAVGIYMIVAGCGLCRPRSASSSRRRGCHRGGC
ncbi:DUF3566 domain-containing protein [Streptomyces mirabilis]|uniref:DUF3566 domain-containing protein n=1 Tax=Streptomyces mirabilis TaxID=68239 RepID=UPI00167E4C70|nr:DUF3566 domain-containing protein [Streptomyces mirabilis]